MLTPINDNDLRMANLILNDINGKGGPAKVGTALHQLTTGEGSKVIDGTKPLDKTPGRFAPKRPWSRG